MTNPLRSPPAEPAIRWFHRRWFVHTAACIVLLALHALPSLLMRAPSALNDELTYLGFARFFARVSALPSEPTSAFGAFGYSLLIAPAFWIFHSFTLTYHAVLILNGIFLTTCYPLMYLIGRRVLGSSQAVASGAAFLCALYPSFLLFSNYATTENAYVPAFLAYCLVSFWYIQKPVLIRGFYFGAATGAMYMLHSRSLGIMASALILQIILLGTRRLSFRSCFAFFLAIGSLIALVRLISVQLISGTGLGEVSMTGTLKAILSVDSVSHALIVLLGEIFDLTVSSVGLSMCGLLFAVSKARHYLRAGNDGQSRALAIAFWISTVLSVFCVSAIFLAAFDPALSRPDFLANGRYPEGVSVLLIGLGATWLFDRSFNQTGVRYSASCLLLIAATAAALTPFWKNMDWLAGPGARIGMLTLVGMMRMVRSTAILPVAAAAAVFIVVWVSVAHIKPAFGAGLICLMFVTVALVEFKTDLLGQQEAFARAAGTFDLSSPLLLIEPISRLAAGTPVSYDLASWTAVTEAYFQLWCPDKRFIAFDSRSGQPSTPIVVAARRWKSASIIEMGCETAVDACLFVPSNAVDQLLSPVPLALEIGAHTTAGLQMEGVYPIERGVGVPFRWTDGHAELRTGKTAARQVAIELRIPKKERLVVGIETGSGRVNLFDSDVQPGDLRQLLPLPPSINSVAGIYITSETFEPEAVNGYTRKLGVQIFSLCLLNAGGWCRAPHGP